MCGSRSWSDWDAVFDRLSDLPRGSTIIHGGARGADQMAGTVGARLGFTIEVYPADWGSGAEFNSQAGFERNLRMLELSPDLVLAFWDGRSSGTKHTLDAARRKQIPVEVIGPMELFDI